jgi:hypothetical protein
MSETTTKDAARIVELTEKLARDMNKSSDESIAAHARQAFKLADTHSLSFARIAELVSRARVRLARVGAGLPPVSEEELAILADDDAYRVSSSTVSSWVQSIKRLEAWGVTHTHNARATAAEKLAADVVVAASYRLGGRARSGDALAAVGVTVLAAPVSERSSVATRELVAALAAWRMANRGPATETDAPATDAPATTEPEEETTEEEAPATPATVPPSADVVCATVAGILPSVAGFDAAQLALVLDSLDALYGALTELPVYAEAREQLAAV